MPADRKTLVVSRNQAGLRLDVWITQQLSGFSRSRVQALIRSGHVTVDGKVVKEHHKTRQGERIQITRSVPDPVCVRAEPIPLEILHQDADIIVINKPPGLVAHPASNRHSGTLVNALLYHCPDLSKQAPLPFSPSDTGNNLDNSTDRQQTFIDPEGCTDPARARPGIVHRLDKDTSGVMVAAKNGTSLKFLLGQFRDRLVRKEYLAIVWGCPEPASGVIRTMMRRHPVIRTKMSPVSSGGRHAITRYRTITPLKEISLILARPETGRTHQLRVHLAHLGHAIVGDRKYGRDQRKDIPTAATRQMLHSWKLSFTHPGTRRTVEFTAPIPPDMLELIHGTVMNQNPVTDY